MKRVAAAIFGGIFISALVGLASAQAGVPDSFDQDDFLSRKKWYLNFTLSLKGMGGATTTDTYGRSSNTQWNIDREVSGEMALDRVTAGDGPWTSVTKINAHERLGRLISWSPTGAKGKSLTYRINDLVRHEFLGHGEGNAPTREWDFKKVQDAGTLALNNADDNFGFACDIKDMIFDVTLSTLMNGVGGGEEFPKTVKITGERRGGNVSETLTPESRKPGSLLPQGNLRGGSAGLWQAMLGRKLELHEGKIDFTVSVPITALPEPYSGKTDGNPPLDLTMHIILSPGPISRAKLILKPEAAYSATTDSWRPLCSDSEDKPGNNLKVDWRLEEENGDPAKPAKVKSVVFTLLLTSKEPGVCMNYPLQPKIPADFDLKFQPSTTPLVGYSVTTDGQKLTLYESQVSAGKGSAIVDCFDSGATGTLIAEALLEDGRTLKAVVEKTGDTKLMIPDCDPEVSWIARGWRTENAKGKKDDDDDENFPVGDGQVGDGFTVWEEYRGFWVGGKWEGGDTKTKDLFVFNSIGGRAQKALTMFGDITGLRVHDKLDADEFRLDRIMNFNKGTQHPHLVDQHYLWLVGGGYEIKGQDFGMPVASCSMGSPSPGPPKNTLFVSILASVVASALPLTQDRKGESYDVSIVNNVICHELGHAIGIPHHGDGDSGLHELYYRSKPSSEDFSKTEFVTYVDGVTVRLLNEKGERVAFPVLTPKKGEYEQIPLYIGEPRGQHSGDEICVMRYDCADTYRSATASDVLYVFGTPEIMGNRLCTSSKGTGVNAPRTPQPRYFDAAKDRGDCAHKFVISDHWEKKVRQ